MKPSTSRCAAVEAWSREGAHAELDTELQSHLDGCGDCQALVDEVLETRRVLSGLPTREIRPERLEEISFNLMAAVRNRQPSTAPNARPPKRSPRYRVLLAVAAVFIATLVGVGIWSQPDSAVAMMEVKLDPAAEGYEAGSPTDMVYVLVGGSAEFSVRPLEPGERFRVVAHGDTIEVRGTQFRAELEDGRFSRVHVSEGHVALLLSGGPVVDLHAGQTWKREGETLARTSPIESEASDLASPTTTTEVGTNAVEGEAEAASRPSLAPYLPEPSKARRVAHSASSRKPGIELEGAAPVASLRPKTGLGAAHDVAFRAGWRLFQQKRYGEAAAIFDELSGDTNLDPARRADVLYWSARAHSRARHDETAKTRARAALSEAPNTWHAAEAALLLGESALAEGNEAQARRWLERAAQSPRAKVRERAQRHLRTMRVVPE